MTRFYFEIKSASVFDVIKAESLKMLSKKLCTQTMHLFTTRSIGLAQTQLLPAMKIDPIIENRRQAYLDWLYERSNKSNQLYTGLYQNRIKELIQKDMDETLGPLGDWH